MLYLLGLSARRYCLYFKAVDHMKEEHHFDREGDPHEVLDPELSVSRCNSVPASSALQEQVCS